MNRHHAGMSSAGTISAAAAAIKEAMTAAVVDPNATVASDRRSWNDAVANDALADGSDEHLEEIAGVPVSMGGADRRRRPGDHRVRPRRRAHSRVIGDASRVASRLALATNCKVLLVDYRLLPEHDIADPIADVVSVHRELVARYRRRSRAHSVRGRFVGRSAGGCCAGGIA